MTTLDDLEAALDRPEGLPELDHGNPKRRRDALDRVMGLGRRYAGLARPLLARLEAEDNPFVLSRAVSVAGAICPAGEGCAAGAAVARLLANADARVVANAVDALRALGDPAHRAAVRALAGHRASRVRANAAVYLAGAPDFDAAAAVTALLHARDPLTRRSGLWALAQIGGAGPPAWTPDPVALVQEATRARDAEVAEGARALLARWAGAGSTSARAALEALAQVGGGESGLKALEAHVPALSKRAYAWLLDSVVLGLLALGALAWLASNDAGRDTRAFRVHTQLVMLAYSIVFFVRDGFGGGRGFAKRLVGLRVLDRERGTGCGFVSSMIRQATFYLPLVNVCEVVWAALDPEGCRLVDRLLGTMVVDERERALTRFDRAMLTLCGLAFTVGSIGAFVLATAGDLGLLRRWLTW